MDLEYTSSSSDYSSTEEDCFIFKLPNLSSCFSLLKYIPVEDMKKMKPLKCKLSQEEMEKYAEHENLFNKGIPFEISYVELKIAAYDFFNFYINSCESIDDKYELRNHFLFLPNLKERLKNPSDITLASADDYNSWYRVCFALKFLFGKNHENLGLELFHTFSKLSEKYKEDECNTLWEKANPDYGSIGHVFKYIKPKKIIPNVNRNELVKKCMKTKFEN